MMHSGDKSCNYYEVSLSMYLNFMGNFMGKNDTCSVHPSNESTEGSSEMPSFDQAIRNNNGRDAEDVLKCIETDSDDESHCGTDSQLDREDVTSTHSFYNLQPDREKLESVVSCSLFCHDDRLTEEKGGVTKEIHHTPTCLDDGRDPSSKGRGATETTITQLHRKVSSDEPTLVYGSSTSCVSVGTSQSSASSKGHQRTNVSTHSKYLLMVLLSCSFFLTSGASSPFNSSVLYESETISYSDCRPGVLSSCRVNPNTSCLRTEVFQTGNFSLPWCNMNDTIDMLELEETEVRPAHLSVWMSLLYPLLGLLFLIWYFLRLFHEQDDDDNQEVIIIYHPKTSVQETSLQHAIDHEYVFPKTAPLPFEIITNDCFQPHSCKKDEDPTNGGDPYKASFIPPKPEKDNQFIAYSSVVVQNTNGSRKAIENIEGPSLFVSNNTPDVKMVNAENEKGLKGDRRQSTLDDKVLEDDIHGRIIHSQEQDCSSSSARFYAVPMSATTKVSLWGNGASSAIVAHVAYQKHPVGKAVYIDNVHPPNGPPDSLPTTSLAAAANLAANPGTHVVEISVGSYQQGNVKLLGCIVGPGILENDLDFLPLADENSDHYSADLIHISEDNYECSCFDLPFGIRPFVAEYGN